MKIGSIVECVGRDETHLGHKTVVGAKYTVVDIGDPGQLYSWIEKGKYVCLEFHEIPTAKFNAIFFREIEFPPSLSEQIKELISQPIEI